MTTPPPLAGPAGSADDDRRHSGSAGADTGAVLRAPRAAAPRAAAPPPAAATPTAAPLEATTAVRRATPAAPPPLPYGNRAAGSWASTAAAATPAAGATGLADQQQADVAVAAAAPQGGPVAALDTALAAPEVVEPHRPRPTRPQRRRRPWTVGGVHVLQLVLWEAAVAAVVAVHRQPLAVLVPVVVLAVVLVVLTAVRRRGRWLHQWLGLWLRFRVRRRSVPLGAAGTTTPDVATTLLDALSRGAHLGQVLVDDDEVGTIVHTTGLSVLVETSPEGSDPTTETIRTVPPLTALLPPVEEGGPTMAVQLLVQTVPAPAWAGAGDPAALSYRQLTGGAAPARRRCWVALQVIRSPDDDGTADLEVPLVNGLRRLRRQLGRAGLRTQLLGRADLAGAVLGVAGLEAGPHGLPRGAEASSGDVTETWSTWRAGAVRHTTFRLLDWPSLDVPAGQELVDRLGTSAAVPTTVSVAARRVSPDEVELATSLRVVLPGPDAGSTALSEVTAAITGMATECGARVERLDGRQAAGMAAAVPFGGFLR
jgi:type VII secretion protein EccE